MFLLLFFVNSIFITLNYGDAAKKMSTKLQNGACNSEGVNLVHKKASPKISVMKNIPAKL